MRLVLRFGPLWGRYRFTIGLVGIIAACHSGESRDLLALRSMPHDSGSDAAVDELTGDPSEGGVLAGAAGATSITPSAAGVGGSTAPTPAGSAGFASDGGSGGAAGSSGGSGGSTALTPGDGGPSNDDAGDGGGDIPDAREGEAETGVDHADAGPHCGAVMSPNDECAITQLALGMNYSCALSKSGHVKCWGADYDGSLGRGTLGAQVGHPSQLEPLDFGTSRRVTQISAGYNHTCVRFEDGKARCWGGNAAGQLGIGGTDDYGDQAAEQLSVLQDLPLNDVQSITAGATGTCAITGNAGQATMHCWGDNIRGELGIGNKTQQTSVGQAVSLGSGRYPTTVVMGWHWTCAALDTGAVRCWGDDDYGVRGVGPTTTWLGDDELPDSDTYNVVFPAFVTGPVTQLSGISSTVCALAEQGAVYCWGENLGGQAGYPFASYGDTVWQPHGKVNLGNVYIMQVHTSFSHSCALADSGFVFCWGSDVSGALGYPGVTRVGYERDAQFDYELMQAGTDGGSDAGTPGLPVGAIDLGDFDETPGPDLATSIASMNNRSCAIMQTGALRCWGGDGYILGYPEVDFIGLTDSPARAYQQLGYSDVNVFGPPAASSP